MPEALASLLRKAPLIPEKVAFAWRAAVGPAVSNATTIELRDQVLHVRVKDRMWRREVQRSVPLIRARLDALLGEGVVRAIETTVGGAAETPSDGHRRAATPPRTGQPRRRRSQP
jgi:hypothetical protein